MNIIKKLRHLAVNNRVLWRTQLENEIRRVANTLEANNAIVAIPVGDEKPIHTLEGDWFLFEGKIYKHEDSTKGVTWNFGIDLEGNSKAINDHELVQPVHLMPLDKWEGGAW